MTVRFIGALLALLLAGTSTAADDPASLRVRRDIQLPAPARTAEELIAIPLDSDVYAESSENLADLRIFDAVGHAVPYLIRKQVETKPYTARRSWPAREPKLRPLEGGGLEIRVDLNDQPPDPDPQPTGLRFVTPLKNFEQRVQVFGIDGSGEEQLLVGDGLIFDYSQYMDVRHQEIRFPESTRRQFRIVIDAVTSDQESQLLELTRRLRSGSEEERQERTMIQRRPFRIDRIEFLREETRTGVAREKRRTYPANAFEVQIDEDQKQTLVTIDTNREPLVAFHLETPSRNFSRCAAVQVAESRGGSAVWREIGSATISRFQFRELNKEELRIEFPEQRRRQFRVVIDNGDSPPVEVQGVQGEGPLHELMMLAAPDATYRLGYGADDAEAPQYDTAALQALLRRGTETVEATLSPPTEQSVEKRLDFLGLVNHPVVIGSVIVLLVIALGWALFRASQRIEKFPPDTE